MAYSFNKSNLSRIINGYDDCGNVCGVKNDWNTLKNCGVRVTLLSLFKNQQKKISQSNDKTLDKFDLGIGFGVSTSKCVASCKGYPGYTQVGNRCLPLGRDDDISYIERLADRLKDMWHIILIGFAVALIFSGITLVLFRFVINFIVWGLIIGTVALFTITSVIFLAISLENTTPASNLDYSSHASLVISTVCGIFALIIGFLSFYFRKKIALVIRIFKEAAKALNDIPLIVAEPFLTFVTMLIAFFIFLYFAIVIQSSAELKIKTDQHGEFLRAYYEPDAWAITSHIVNMIAFCFFTKFVVGCQQYVIASTISDWYLSRSKHKLNSPISRGFKNLLNFHLGSICFGSIVFINIAILRQVVESLKVS